MIEGIYKLISKDENGAIIELSDKKHKVFQAHFPTQPILPGFIHFEIVSELFDIEITTIKKAKFMKSILPSETLKYEKSGNKFKVFRDEEVVASFNL